MVQCLGAIRVSILTTTIFPRDNRSRLNEAGTLKRGVQGRQFDQLYGEALKV